MFNQKSYSLEMLTEIDLRIFSEEDKKKCIVLMDLEKAKIEKSLEKDKQERVKLD